MKNREIEMSGMISSFAVKAIGAYLGQPGELGWGYVHVPGDESYKLAGFLVLTSGERSLLIFKRHCPVDLDFDENPSDDYESILDAVAFSGPVCAEFPMADIVLRKSYRCLESARVPVPLVPDFNDGGVRRAVMRELRFSIDGYPLYIDWPMAYMLGLNASDDAVSEREAMLSSQSVEWIDIEPI